MAPTMRSSPSKPGIVRFGTIKPLNLPFAGHSGPGMGASGGMTPTAPPPPGATPGTAPPVQSLDPAAEATKAANDRTYGDVTGALDYEAGRIKQQYGFDDLSDPFSRAAVLQHSYQNRQRGTTNTLAARGQLYSGAYQNQQGIDTRAYDQAYHGLRGSYADALKSVEQRRIAATTARDNGNLGADAAALTTAINTRPDPTELPQADIAQPAPAAKTLSTAAAGRRKKRQQAGVTDTRGLSAAAIKKLRQRGLLP